jgi:dihydrodipicolinate synthase/N-acetylneuraminate lyase
MSPEFLRAVSDVKSICAIKESSGSFARMLEQRHFDARYQRIAARAIRH